MNSKKWVERFKEGKAGPWLWAALAVMVLAALVTGIGTENDDLTRQEARLAKVLSLMEGAGRVEAVLFYPEEGASLWQEESQPRLPIGAVIVAQGAGQIEVRLRLVRAASTLLGLKTDQIAVFPMESKEGAIP